MKSLAILVTATILGPVLEAASWIHQTFKPVVEDVPGMEQLQEAIRVRHPLEIEYLREQSYPGSELTIERELSSGSGFRRYIASYYSQDLKQYGLLNVPIGEKPSSGWPVIIFNHGWIQPSEHRTHQRYGAYQAAFASNGYIVFKPDYRGHGESEGQARGGYSNPDYTIDVLNALASLQQYSDADPNRIGMWGHSMGGQITLKSMMISPNIKAGVIWAGVVADYPNILTNWHRGMSYQDTIRRPGWRDDFLEMYGSPTGNPEFWDLISPNTYVSDISGPIQLHHAKADESVPYQFSELLTQELEAADKEVELFLYEGDNHNISGNFTKAINASLEFFDTYVKEATSAAS